MLVAPALNIRPVEAEDNAALEKIIKAEMSNFPCSGDKRFDDEPELAEIFETFNAPGSRYWVLVDEVSGDIFGGGGFCPLKGMPEGSGICELQKFYLAPDARGDGWGFRLIEILLREARQMGYQRVYLESDPAMTEAQKLYTKLGFERLNEPLGNTGFSDRCTVYMALDMR